MNKRRFYDTRRSNQVFTGLLLGGILFVLISTLFSYQTRRSEIEQNALIELNRIKNTCQKYDDYELGILTKDLQAMINKANVLRDYEADDTPDEIELLEDAARTQYLSGIIILNQELAVEHSINLDGSAASGLLSHILEEGQPRQILAYPKKTFANRVTLDGRWYEYGIAARIREQGILICYMDTTEFQNDKYEISLGNLLTTEQDSDLIYVVTDGTTVLSSNGEGLTGLPVESCPITNVADSDMRPEDSGLIELNHSGKTWYGKHALYRGYYLYVFYKSSVIYPKMLLQLSITVGIYLLFCVVLLLYLQNNRKRWILQLEEAAQQAAIANAAKTDFLRRMSHDIRTPLNGIRGMADIGLECAEDPDKVADCLKKIRLSSDFLLDLATNVLDMTKIEAGVTETENESFDIREIFGNAVNMVITQAQKLEIDFRQVDFVGEHWQVKGSPLNIQRVFQNLMSNAAKYNHPGGAVRVSLEETEADPEHAAFTFVCADTGMGMSPEFQKRAFDLFEQEHATARTTYKGSGLGLTIVKKTVELLGGTIDLVSKEGEGTTVTVKFILPIDSDTKNQEECGKEPDNGPKLAGLRILVAEDNDLNREIENYMLTADGAEVTEARDGKEAVELFSQSKPGGFDVILMDIMMPVMDGLEAAITIRGMDRSDAATIPIIAVSANAFSDDVEASKACGINEHLPKPLDYGAVMESIRKYVK